MTPMDAGNIPPTKITTGRFIWGIGGTKRFPHKETDLYNFQLYTPKLKLWWPLQLHVMVDNRLVTEYYHSDEWSFAFEIFGFGFGIRKSEECIRLHYKHLEWKAKNPGC